MRTLLTINKKIFMQSFSLYTSLLFFIPSNVHAVYIKYLQRMYSPTFIVDNFTELLLHIYFLNQRFKIYINNRCALSDFWYWLNDNILVSSKGITIPQQSLFSYAFFIQFKFVFCSKWVKVIQKMKPTIMFWHFFFFFFFYDLNCVL